MATLLFIQEMPSLPNRKEWLGMETKEYAYIYNWDKAQFFIREGHDVVGRPTHSAKTGRIYFKFIKDEKLLETTKKFRETMDFIQKIKKN